ncbi:MAG: class I SAM-dependent methyltransferase [Woeseia sp.]
MSHKPAFKDHFSGHADRYATFRPTYPTALFEFLADCCERREHAWDCATGNGQTARALTEYFTRVTATDASAAQVQAADVHAQIDYRVATAEASGLADRSVDLVTVSQALHWFDIDRFFDEAQRVLVPGGVLAAWSYALCSVDAACDAVIGSLYEAVDAYWPPERAIVEDGYRGIQLPMPAIAAPAFEMSALWSAETMLGYLRTWSACQRSLRDSGIDPVAAIESALRTAWGADAREVHWPLALRVGRV